MDRTLVLIKRTVDLQACCGPFSMFATATPISIGAPKSLNFNASLNSPRLKRISLLCNGRLRNKPRRFSTGTGIGAAELSKGRARSANNLKYISDIAKVALEERCAVKKGSRLGSDRCEGNGRTKLQEDGPDLRSMR